MTANIQPVLLVVLDGWGYTDNVPYNAIQNAHTPVWDDLWENRPHTLLDASGTAVGLPDTQMGNSEVGHMHIGAGRLLPQDLTRINNAIEDKSFFTNETLCNAFRTAAANDKAVHLLGLLSPGGVHGHEEHLLASMDLAKQCGVKRLYIHAFLDGRDCPPKSAAASLRIVMTHIRQTGIGRIASLCGRFYAMDRNHRWERIKKAYDLIAHGRGDHTHSDPLIALEESYKNDLSDEFVRPTMIDNGEGPVTVADGDVMLFTNFRADRIRHLAAAFHLREFDAFDRSPPPRPDCISMTLYHRDYDIPCAFPPEKPINTLGQSLAHAGLKQLRIAETEKYAHVTYFLNGGEEQAQPGEQRILIPSPHVATYDQRPEMSAAKITEKLLQSLHGHQYDAIICNYANADMVGHTGNIQATIKAVEVLDSCLGELVQASRRAGYDMLITADHGNAEQLRTYTTEKIQPHTHTAHTCNPVPFVYIGERPAEIRILRDGSLADIAPTVLDVMGLPIPKEMTGRKLLRLDKASPVSAAVAAGKPT